MLVYVYRRFLLESEELRQRFKQSIFLPIDKTLDIAGLSAEMAVIRLHDSWARFSRELVICSAGGNGVTESGIHLPKAPNITGDGDVIPKLISTYKKRSNEPSWFSAKECIDAAKRLNVQNYQNILVSIGSSNSPSEDIRIVRNFYAHRCKNTAEKIRNRHWFDYKMRLRPEFILEFKVTGGISMFELWIIQLQAVAKSAIQ